MWSWHGRHWHRLFEEERAHRLWLEHQLAAVQHAQNATQAARAAAANSYLSQALRQAGEALSALTILGFAVYAGVWVLYSSFCREFKLRPEDIGLTYAAILVRAGVGCTPIVLAFLVLQPHLAAEDGAGR